MIKDGKFKELYNSSKELTEKLMKLGVFNKLNVMFDIGIFIIII